MSLSLHAPFDFYISDPVLCLYTSHHVALVHTGYAPSCCFLPLTHLNSSSTPDSIAASPWSLLTDTDLIYK